MSRIIGIESSCDESAVAVFEPERGLTAEWVHSQILKHQPFGGIVPDLASREHLDNFPELVDRLQATGELAATDPIAVTTGPGLAGCLAMGLIVGQALQFVSGGPLVGVNHLRGHAFSPFIPVHAQDPAGFRKAFDALLPHLGLIVSGGNTVLFSLEAGGVISVLAATVDDAAGEALDKGAKLLGMPYPGGPLIEKAGAGGVATAYDFPRAFADNKEARFSFSGLKTSLRYTMEKLSPDSLATEMPHLCASYQEAVVDALARKTNQFLKRGGWRSVGLSGGVANNGRLKEAFTELANGQGIPLLQALPRHTGDNAGMIAFAAFMDPAGCEAEPTSFRPVWELA